ncbi:MAG: glycosyltransferase [Armatimonadota bacterium]|nr:MAG: glycosyltransferase [Armatimonadota bacterium]
MRIAIVGSRGIPARYGGFETCAEQVSRRLADAGHEVAVYCLRRYVGPASDTPPGVRRIFLPTIHHKALEKPLFTWLSLVHAAASRAEVILALGISGGPATMLPGLLGRPVVTNIDGLEWQRAKWGTAARAVLRLFEASTVRMSNAVVSDAAAIWSYCVSRYGRRPWLIPYGAEIVPTAPGAALRELGLESRKYFLVVGRLEPESNVDVIIRAHAGLPDAHPVVIVGDAPYAQQYIRQLKRIAGPKVAFAGYVFGSAYRELQSNAYAYISATDVGGTHPALLEAMAYGNCVVVSDIAEHQEIAAGAGILFKAHDVDDLADRLGWLMRNPGAARALGERAGRRARGRYSWDVVADEYARLLDCCRNGHAAKQVGRDRAPSH